MFSRRRLSFFAMVVNVGHLQLADSATLKKHDIESITSNWHTDIVTSYTNDEIAEFKSPNSNIANDVLYYGIRFL